MVACIYDPPEVAWLPPELDTGADPELKPLDELLELLELLELELLSSELLEFELEPVEVLDELEWLVDVELVAWADPGSTRATTPAVAALATPTAAVAERTLALPRSLAATARMILSRFMPSSSATVLEVLCGLLLSHL